MDRATSSSSSSIDDNQSWLRYIDTIDRGPTTSNSSQSAPRMQRRILFESCNVFKSMMQKKE
jgi:hypothetical protein